MNAKQKLGLAVLSLGAVVAMSAKTPSRPLSTGQRIIAAAQKDFTEQHALAQ
jgi:hypothetical protein